MGWLRAHSISNKPWAILLSAALLLALAAGISDAQTLVTIQNGKLSATVGEKDSLNGVDVAGRFGVTEVGESAGVLLQLPRSADLNQLGSYLTVRIDGGTPYQADGTVAEGREGWDIAWGYTETPDTDIKGEWVQVPTVVSPTVIVAKWRTVPDAEADPPIPEIRVDLQMRLVYDMVLYTFTITNKDTRAHRVGLRFAQDFNVPDNVDGPIMTSRTAMISTETALVSTSIPTWWRAAAEQGSSSVGSILLPTGSSPYPTRPDQVAFGLTAGVVAPLWDFTPTPGESFVGTLLDGSAALYYNPKLYAPNQTGQVSMLFGAAGASYEFGQRLAAGLEGPVSLTYDPSRPTDEQLQPNPITVTAFLHNMNTVSLSSVQAVLSLPEGLELAAGQTALKTAGSVSPDGEVTFRWQVVPNGTASGRLTYSVSLSAEPGGQGVSVARDIDIPALPTQGFGAGWQMVSFPYVLDDRAPSEAINLDPALYDLVRWNPTLGQYQAVQYLNPGEGYWLRLAGNASITLANGQPVQVPGGSFVVRLASGWNQIANPYLLRVRWGDIKVITTDATDPDYLRPLTVQEASGFTKRWISSAVFRYDVATGSYAFDQDFATDLVPFVGYWIRANRSNLELLIPKPSGRAAVVSNLTRASAKMAGGWRLQLRATDGASWDSCSYIGLAQDAFDGADPRDVAKPPAVAGSVSLAILSDEASNRGAALAQDIRSASSAPKQWRIAVVSPQPNTDVTITWPDIATLPKTHELYLTDDGGGPRKSMRQMSSFKVNTGATGTRMLTVTAEPRTAGGAFRITSWNVAASRGKSTATIAVGTTQQASLNIRVVGASGATIRKLTSRSAGMGDLSQITWDLRDAKGVAVPAGTYTVEIKAVTTDGQSARVVAPLVVTR